MAIKIRKSRVADREFIEKLAEEYAEAIHLTVKRERFFKAIGTAEVLVVEIDDRFAGFIYAYFKGRGEQAFGAGYEELHISVIIVRPEFRKQGIATKLIGYLRDKSTKPVTAHVDFNNTGAMRTFIKLGFKIVYKDGDRITFEYSK